MCRSWPGIWHHADQALDDKLGFHKLLDVIEKGAYKSDSLVLPVDHGVAERLRSPDGLYCVGGVRRGHLKVVGVDLHRK